MSTPSSEGWGASRYGSDTDSLDYTGSGSADGESTLSRGAITSRTEPTRAMGAQPTTATHPESVTTASQPAGDSTRAATAIAPARGKQATRSKKGPRRVRLAVARVDPWSVMKMSFLLSVALGIAGVILTAVLWMILSTMNVFTDIEGVLQSLQTAGSADNFSIRDYVGFGRVVSLSIVIGVIDVILLTAIATVMAFLYNICSALVGGIQLTLTDD
ncbi:DUF3566 domain-containing protein [Intrasporangium calvum]|uniref:DUF3566 domain-containing protein n=1 Tax=Intrasporangium calvum (strain ATCC 23552 / DSM 43043 / JCM 3097 / NBRC 12989 / NCIMB 10167 / NRRL B-3866 / 7 KIP) TaxID=710696 RepID=E6SDX0_INTC7|nr:DUF3566 domain-containing protein [Intrasporangium calvum]ADU46573.1 hypothetical protein Intca_0011 [Intrasporangium calvum DSM 43043]